MNADERKALAEAARAIMPNMWFTGMADEIGCKGAEAKYVATASPERVLSLLADLEAAERSRDSWAADCAVRARNEADLRAKLEAAQREAESNYA